MAFARRWQPEWAREVPTLLGNASMKGNDARKRHRHRHRKEQDFHPECRAPEIPTQWALEQHLARVGISCRCRSTSALPLQHQPVAAPHSSTPRVSLPPEPPCSHDHRHPARQRRHHHGARRPQQPGAATPLVAADPDPPAHTQEARDGPRSAGSSYRGITTGRRESLHPSPSRRNRRREPAAPRRRTPAELAAAVPGRGGRHPGRGSLPPPSPPGPGPAVTPGGGVGRGERWGGGWSRRRGSPRAA